MDEPPPDHCGYIWPEDYDENELNLAYHQNCCYRETFEDTDRCVWHVNPDEVDEKPIDALHAVRTSSEIREQNSPSLELLDGAKLPGVELNDSISLERMVLREADLTAAHLNKTKLTDTHLWGADLTDASLRGSDLTNTHLKKVDFTDADLQNADLSSAFVQMVNLNGATLQNADLSSTYLWTADLTGAYLQNTNLTGANLEGADLTDVNLEGANLTDAYLGKADFTKANIKEVNLTDAYLDKADLTKANLKESNFTDAYLEEADLKETDLKETDFSGANLRETNLTDASLESATLRAANLIEANLTNASIWNADLTDASLVGANLPHANFENANLTETTFGGANLTETTFRGANLTEASLLLANLTDADLTQANLRGAILSGANLRRANLKSINVSQTTKCGRQTRAEENADSPSDWDEIAQAYHDLKLRFGEDHGLVGKARELYLLERQARGKEAEANGDRWNYYGSLASNYLTGYGVNYRRIVAVMLVVFAIPTFWYWLADIDVNVLYFSIVTFTTAPPITPNGFITQVVAGIQTFLGTLLIVLLGYVLGNRESF